MTKQATLPLPESLTISDYYRDPEIISHLSKEFFHNQFVKLPDLFLPAVKKTVQENLQYLHGLRTRKDFIMPGFDTERRMSVVGGSKVINLSLPLIALYGNRDLRETLTKIIGSHIHTVQHAEEFMVVNFLDGEADTHGWHIDDPQYALIIITEAPPPNSGGELELIPSWSSFCTENGFSTGSQTKEAIQQAIAENRVKRSQLAAGDCYLLNASEAFHRVTPIIGNGSRKALNMAFDSRRFRNYGNTAQLLYAN